MVLSHDSTENKILGKFSREYKGEIIRLKNALGNIFLTPEHLVFAMRIPKGDKFKRNKGKKQLIPSWYHAEYLKKGDIILYPFSRKEKNIKYLTIDIPKPKYDFRSKNIPSKISLNMDLLRLFGYFLSEGNIQDKPSKTYISFALHIKEKEIVEDIRKIVKRLFDLEIKSKERIKENGVVVYIYHAQLARWFKKLFGNGTQNKYLPEFIMQLPISKQKALIKGLWKGDGCINVNRIGPRAGYVTISYRLSQQIKILLLRQKIISSFYIEKEKKSKWANHKEAYRIHVGQRDSLKKLCKILNLKHCSKSYESISSWINNNFLYTPITKIERKNYKGKVYNLEVEKTHSFISESFCLHNCGDVMWVYIKVKNDKITKIKFKTFGCAAAIATSSMVTQLAKGKTTKDAKKIKIKDVASSLKGLPPLKMHCSELATDALKLAIKDYEKKKTNKKKNENRTKSKTNFEKDKVK
ncbi:iron-sulfur cluster assembly scaffold protein [Candidatus Pacearchaeota archaeon]|nr:iron-sulfur cluster assembly scaffold protein [Candidatus Pacearchaeota archaeon]